MTQIYGNLETSAAESTSVVVALVLTDPEAPSTDEGRAAIIADQEDARTVNICWLWRAWSSASTVAVTKNLLSCDTVATVAPVTSPRLVPSCRTCLRIAKRRSPAPESRASSAANAFAVDFVSAPAAMATTTVIGSRLTGSGRAFSVAKWCGAVPAR